MSSGSNPFEQIERLVERMSRQFEDASRGLEGGEPGWQLPTRMKEMAVDLVEHDDEFVLTADLPGFENEDVDLRVTDHELRIDAEREEAIDEEAEDVLRHERRQASVQRSITLPVEVDTDGVTARMNNGVLSVTLPKIEGGEAREIDIE